MQSASLETLAKVSFLSVVGPDATDNAATYLNTLIVRHCDLIVAVGPAEVAAVSAQAPSSPSMHFAVVGGGEGAANVAAVALKTDADTAAIVAAVVKSAVHGSFAGGPASS
jgi:basic membrane lipoprotein Med (substrate-binding protein (PBP1-ABC) superfamily)